MGVVAQVRQDTFVLTELGEKSRKDVANSAWPAIILWADLLADNWSSLTECVRTGESAASLRPEIMKRWREEPEGPAIFLAVMGTSPADSYLPIARVWDFSDARVVADLGGGGGAMIEAILETFPKRLLSDLNMLAVTGGKERDTLEWRSLTVRAALRCGRITPVPEDLVSIIECTPQ
jgi:hypothetical protein